MNNEELDRLKAELKKEILNELVSKQVVKENIWKVVREEYEPLLYDKGYSTYEVAQIFSGIAVIVRYSLGYKMVALIPKSEEKNLRMILSMLINLIPNCERS